MAELVFTAMLSGSAAPVEGRENTFRAQTSGKGSQGEDVTFESEVVLSGDSFLEFGRISYAGRGAVRFNTMGAGHIGPSPVSGLSYGAVDWRVIEGDGEFQGATGIITSNFTFSETGQVVDNQYARIFTP